MKIADNAANPRFRLSTGVGMRLGSKRGRLIAMDATPEDPDPSPLGRSYVGAVNDDLRIRQPMVRERLA